MGEPKLRFKADDGSDFPDWEEMTLGDVGSVAMCKRVFKEQTCEVGDVPFFKIGTFGGAPDAYISQSLFDELKSKYAYPKVGTILLSASGTIGRQVEYKGEDAYYQDSNIVWLEHDDTVLDSYLKQFYSVVKWQGLEGSTIKRLYNKTILDTPFYRPSLPEQRKIGDFLSAVDAVIAAQQAEVDAWEQRKKGVMQKLFSQEVRFKADDGSEFPEWEEKTLGDILTVCHGRDYKHLGKGVYPVMGTGGVMTYVDEFLCDWPCALIGRKGTINRPMYMDVPFWCVDTLFYTKPKSDQSPLWQYDLFQTINWNKYNEASGVPSLSASTIEGIAVKVPSLPEQRKIADCLSSFDEVIVKARDELAAWQELKKGLLQQMFV